MKTRTIVLWFVVLWAIITVLCWQSGAMAWEIYRPNPIITPVGVPWNPSYINGMLIESFYPAGHIGGFVSTYNPPIIPQPSGFIDGFIFFFSPAQEVGVIDLDPVDIVIFQPGSWGKLYNVEVFP